MQEMKLQTSKARQALSLLFYLLMIVLGVWLASIGQWFGHIAYLLFGYAFVLWTILLITGGSYLKLKVDGFEFITELGGKRFVKWDDVETIEIIAQQTKYGTFSALQWRYKEGVNVSRTLSHKILSHTPKSEHLIDPFGMKREELLSLMNEYLENHRYKASRFR